MFWGILSNAQKQKDLLITNIGIIKCLIIAHLKRKKEIKL